MIYVIDNDNAVRRAFGLFLESTGVEYKSFASATSFLLEVIPTASDLLVLDLNMPGMSGCDLLRKFSETGLSIPVIVVTAFDDPDSREYCRHYGVKAYQRKPVDGESLIDLIKYNLPE
ncbi:MAG: response regulator [Bacteroidota bacterium]